MTLYNRGHVHDVRTTLVHADGSSVCIRNLECDVEYNFSLVAMTASGQSPRSPAMTIPGSNTCIGILSLDTVLNMDRVNCNLKQSHLNFNHIYYIY